MKTALIVLGVIALVIIMGVSWVSGAYNHVIGLDQAVQVSTAQVQNVMQRQADLIPNMMKTAQAYAKFETTTLTQISEARAKLTAVAKLDPTAITNNPELQKQVVEAQKASSQAMLAINTVTEAYPQLKADVQFTALMTELEGSQNRITVERRNNQLAVQDYNATVLTFPTRFFGFIPKPYFIATEAAQTAPVLNFN